MGTQRVTDDLDRLLELLPKAVREQLQPVEARQQLLEVVLDLGRVPEAVSYTHLTLPTTHCG
mgnify:CR=1 FL=1